MFIQTEATPNPATLKFIPGRTVLDTGTMEFSSAESAARSPLAERLFAVSGVTSVFYGADFVTVTKADGDWQHLKPAILGAIMEHYMSGAPLLADALERKRPVRHERDISQTLAEVDKGHLIGGESHAHPIEKIESGQARKTLEGRRIHAGASAKLSSPAPTEGSMGKASIQRRM